MPLSIRPISAHLLVNARCSSGDMYSQSLAKSSDESVSLFSPSESVSLLTKCASYRRFAQASRRLRQTDRDERRIWLVRANFSSVGNRFDDSKTFIASSYAVLYTAKSFAGFIRAIRADLFICCSASPAGL